MAGGPIPATDAMDVGSGRRLSLAPEAMWLETRAAGGTWVRLRPISYEEIQTVYSFDQRDWAPLGVAVLVWGVLTAVVLIGLAAFSGNLGTVGLLAILLGLGVMLVGFGAYRVATVPRKMLRIDTHTGSLIVPRRHPRFFQTLAEHLEAARKRAPAAVLPMAPPASFPPPSGVPGPVPGFIAPPVPPAAGVPMPPPLTPSPGSIPGVPGPGQAMPPAPPSSPSESGKAPWEA